MDKDEQGEVLNRRECLFPEKMQTRPARFLASSMSVHAVSAIMTYSELAATFFDFFLRRNISVGPPLAPVLQAPMPCHAGQA